MQLTNEYNYSYWELKQYFRQFDLVVVGGGIVGLSAAISFKQKNKQATVLVLERGILPNGASTKNAGFACFGSAGELLDDLSHIKPEVVWETVKMRWDGLQMLRKRLGDKKIAFKLSGGYELFKDKRVYDEHLDQLDKLNKNVDEVLGLKKCYGPYAGKNQFKKIAGMVLNKYEGDIDTGMMMDSLLALAQKNNIKILNNIGVSEINDLKTRVELTTNAGVFKASKVIVATNGFATQLLKLRDVLPARAQVLITKPIPHLSIKGTYHYEQGYYYFRNIDGRVLLGGGRNLDIETETTTEPRLNNRIQHQLIKLLKEMILPGVAFEIESQWAGIMGVGKEKKPIIRPVSENVLAAVRMGGMGIAIGSWVGEKAAGEIM
ncbi:MAG: FAD-dependent oxidoreductase [Bacteroidota bacterium]